MTIQEILQSDPFVRFERAVVKIHDNANLSQVDIGFQHLQNARARYEAIAHEFDKNIGNSLISLFKTEQEVISKYPEGPIKKQMQELAEKITNSLELMASTIHQLIAYLKHYDDGNNMKNYSFSDHDQLLRWATHLREIVDQLQLFGNLEIELEKEMLKEKISAENSQKSTEINPKKTESNKTDSNKTDSFSEIIRELKQKTGYWLSYSIDYNSKYYDAYELNIPENNVHLYLRAKGGIYKDTNGEGILWIQDNLISEPNRSVLFRVHDYPIPVIYFGLKHNRIEETKLRDGEKVPVYFIKEDEQKAYLILNLNINLPDSRPTPTGQIFMYGDRKVLTKAARDLITNPNIYASFIKALFPAFEYPRIQKLLNLLPASHEHLIFIHVNILQQVIFQKKSIYDRNIYANGILSKKVIEDRGPDSLFKADGLLVAPTEFE